MVIDFETRSDLDLREVGAYRYAEHPSTTPLCLSYETAKGDVDRWEIGDPFPEEVIEVAARALAGGEPLHAHNATFERLIWNGPLRRLFPALPVLPPEAFDCTMARAAADGWPLKLETLGDAMGLPEIERKAASGRALISACSSTRKPLNAARLVEFFDYCDQDVRAERAVLTRIHPLSKSERRVYLFDQQINDRGVGIDRASALAIQIALTEANRKMARRLYDLTRGAVERQTQTARIVEWCRTRGVSLPDLKAQTVETVLRDPDVLPGDVQEVLQIRADAGGAAVKKIDTMLACVCDDGRARGLLQYHGANTGRWAGRLIQPQNFPRPTGTIDPSWFTRSPWQEIDAIYPGGLYTAASDALRPLMWAAPGKVIRRADLSAIEARIVLWLAGHDDAMQIFRDGKCIYCEMASAVYGYPVTKKEHPEERQNGKVIVLGCGYQMGASRFVEHAADYGLSVTLGQAVEYVGAYRDRWYKVPQLWYGLEKCAYRAVEQGGVHSYHGIDFAVHDGALCCRIPSGRVLRWQGVELDYEDDGDRPRLFVHKVDQGKWKRLSLYGGLITERVTQATARDVMVHGMLRAEEEGLPVVLTVHDEVVTEPFETGPSVKTLEACLTETPRWIPGLPLAAEGAEGRRYGK